MELIWTAQPAVSNLASAIFFQHRRTLNCNWPINGLSSELCTTCPRASLSWHSSLALSSRSLCSSLLCSTCSSPSVRLKWDSGGPGSSPRSPRARICSRCILGGKESRVEIYSRPPHRTDYSRVGLQQSSSFSWQQSSSFSSSCPHQELEPYL